MKISSKASVTSSSEPVKPLRSTLVLSASSTSTPAAPSCGEPVEVDVLAVERRLVDLEVAGVDRPRRAASSIASATQSGMLCVTRRNSIVNAPTVTRSRGFDPRPAAIACAVRASRASSLDSTSASVNGVP